MPSFGISPTPSPRTFLACHPLAQVLPSGFSPLPSALSRFSTVVGPFCGWFLGLECIFLLLFAWCTTSFCDDGHSVFYPSCLADWRAICPGHTQAAASKKKQSSDRCLGVTAFKESVHWRPHPSGRRSLGILRKTSNSWADLVSPMWYIFWNNIVCDTCNAQNFHHCSSRTHLHNTYLDRFWLGVQEARRSERVDWWHISPMFVLALAWFTRSQFCFQHYQSLVEEEPSAKMHKNRVAFTQYSKMQWSSSHTRESVTDKGAKKKYSKMQWCRCYAFRMDMCWQPYALLC